MRKVVFRDLITEHGFRAELTLQEIYDELEEEHCEKLVELLTADGFIEEEKEPIRQINDEDFNGKLDALKTVYYRLYSEEEDMLTNLFKKYL